MSNLGVHTIYDCFNKRTDTLCERFFYESEKSPLLSIETKSPLKFFDILAFSISYELDYINFFKILKKIGLLNKANLRSAMPLILVGGVVTASNHLPLSKFSDVIFKGEAEESLDFFMDRLSEFTLINSKQKKIQFFNQFPKTKGVYIPSQKLTRDIPISYLEDVNKFPTASKIITPETEFSNIFLVEISRGCPQGCNFCVTGAVYAKFRPRRLEILKNQIEFGLKITKKIGLVGAAITEYPQLKQLLKFLKEKNTKISVSSLRVESVIPELLTALSESGQNAVTYAPEAGSDRLRRFLNKKITNKHIIEKIKSAKKCGIKKLKLYFMIGLPQEKAEDIEKIVELVRKAALIMPVRVNVGIFVPKPQTNFSTYKVEKKFLLLSKLKILEKQFRKLKNVIFNKPSIKEAIHEFEFSHADENFFDNYLKNL
ncbi:MAG: radical SAM protein [Candidatus Omnitrophota bacterium]